MQQFLNISNTLSLSIVVSFTATTSSRIGALSLGLGNKHGTTYRL
jgi:hypothetical protein